MQVGLQKEVTPQPDPKSYLGDEVESEGEQVKLRRTSTGYDSPSE